MVHEKAFSTPAASRKSLGATLFERNTMLKTLKRKIALVAVAGLGFGLVSTVPAFAADGTLSLQTGAGNAADLNVYSGQPQAVMINDADIAAPNDAVALTAASSNANVTVAIAKKTGATANQADYSVGKAEFTLTLTSTPGSAQATTITFTYDNDGDAAAATPTTLAVDFIVGATFSAASLGGPIRPNSGQAVDIKLTGTGSLNQTATDGPRDAKWLSISKPTGSATPVLTSIAFTDALSSTTAAKVGTISGIDTAGTYTGIVYYDANDDGAAAATEPQVLFTFTTAGGANAISATAALPSVGASVDTEIIVSLTSAGALTQAINGEFITIVADPSSATSAVTLSNGLASTAAGSATTLTTPVQGAAGSNAGAAIVPAEFADGKASFRINSNTASDTITVTITPSAALVAAGATAQTVTIKTVAAATFATAKATIETNVNIIADALKTSGTTVDVDNLNYYAGSIDVKSATIKVSGLTASASYAPVLTVTGFGGNGATGLAVDGVTYTSGTALTRTSDASGNDSIVVTWTEASTANDRLIFDLNGAAGDIAGQVDADLLIYAFTYATTLTAPAATLVMQKTGTDIAVAGSVADQFGTPIIGATVTVSGAETPSTTGLTKTVTTDNTGKFSTTLTPAAATTKVDLTVAVVKGAIAPANKTATINFSASGSPTAITAVTSPATTTTVIPAVLVAYDGSASGALTDETYTLATATAAGTIDASGVQANEECFSITPTTTPTAQVVYTGTAGVKFSTTACATGTGVTIAAGKDTVTAASGTVVYVFTTKAGLNTVTMTAGDVKATANFFAVNYLGDGNATKNTKAGAAARNIAITAPASVDTTGIGVATVKVTDAFGNPVEFANTVTLTATVTGKALLSGNAVSLNITTTDANGEATIAIIGLTTAGDAVLTVTGAAGVAQFGAAAGAATGTTAGTNGLTASVNAPTATIPVKASAASTAVNTATETAINNVKTDVKAVSDTVATLSKAVTTIQSSVTELTSSFATQIKSLTDAIAKISAAIAALSKKVSTSTKAKK